MGACAKLILGTGSDTTKKGFEKLDAAELGTTTCTAIAPQIAPGTKAARKKKKSKGGKKMRTGRPTRALPTLEEQNDPWEF